jgi:SpoVK/Ycf46/Vps4 family AAA+-type ATPase
VLRASPAPDGIVQAIDLAQRVLGAGAVAAPLDALFEVDGRPFEAALTAVRRLARRSSALVLAGSGSVRAGNLFDTAIDLAVADPSPKERAATWRATLQRRAASTPAAVREAVVLALADRFALPMERILSAATAATERAAIARREVGERELFAAARAVSVADAAGTTQRLETIFDWNDLVLPDEVKRRLADVVHAISLRGQVLDDWSFARRVGGGRGARILLSGPSGTGKSTAAAIIAKALHLDLHRIELASVVSKYIGETEKNLDRAFTAARQANAILFIDEADALLGKRSAVKDAHDRYANVEVAYLLQKLEGDEIVIFATNLAQNLDEAFARRIQYAIEFPLPDPGSRERLWRNMIGPAPVEGALDFGFLARQFELSGGDIRNIVLDSAYRSAADGRPITLDQILLAVARQFVKSGRAPTAAEFREHYALLHETRSPLAASRDAALQPQTAP